MNSLRSHKPDRIYWTYDIYSSRRVVRSNVTQLTMLSYQELMQALFWIWTKPAQLNFTSPVTRAAFLQNLQHVNWSDIILMQDIHHPPTFWYFSWSGASYARHLLHGISHLYKLQGSSLHDPCPEVSKKNQSMIFPYLILWIFVRLVFADFAFNALF